MLIPIGLTLVGLFFNLTQERKITSSENSFWVFHRYNASLIGHQKNHTFTTVLQTLKLPIRYLQIFQILDRLQK